MSDTPSDNKLHLRSTDTNRFKIETGHLKVQSQEKSEQNTATIQIPQPPNAGATQKAVNLNDPMSLRETSKGKLHKITGTGQTASLNPNAANLRTETIRLKVVKKSQQPGTAAPRSSSPLPLAGIKPVAPAEAAAPAPDAPAAPAAAVPGVHPAAVKPVTLKLALKPRAPQPEPAPAAEPAPQAAEPAAKPAASGITPVKAVKPSIDTSTIKLNLKKKPAAEAAAPEKPAEAAAPARPKLSLHLAQSKPAAEPASQPAPPLAAPGTATVAVPAPQLSGSSQDKQASATIAVQPPEAEAPKKPGLKLHLSKQEPAAPAAAAAPEPPKAAPAAEAPAAHHGLKLKSQASATIAVQPPPAADKPAAPAAEAATEKPKLGISKKAQSTVSVPSPTPAAPGASQAAAAAAPREEAPQDSVPEKPSRHILEGLSALTAAIAATVTVVVYVMSLLKM